MKVIEKLRTQLEKMGATLDFDEESYAFNCDAPNGYVWKATGTRSLCVQWANQSQTWLTKAIAGELDTLKEGLEKVIDLEEIEMHTYESGEDWVAPIGSPDRIEWPK